MTRLRALAAAALVAAAVFYYLAAPALRALLGPLVVLPLYALVSVVVGVATYVGVRYLLAEVDDGEVDTTERSPAGEVTGVDNDVPSVEGGLPGAGAETDPEGDEPEEGDVERMLGELDAEREE